MSRQPSPQIWKTLERCGQYESVEPGKVVDSDTVCSGSDGHPLEMEEQCLLLGNRFTIQTQIGMMAVDQFIDLMDSCNPSITDHPLEAVMHQEHEKKLSLHSCKIKSLTNPKDDQAGSILGVCSTSCGPVVPMHH